MKSAFILLNVQMLNVFRDDNMKGIEVDIWTICRKQLETDNLWATLVHTLNVSDMTH